MRSDSNLPSPIEHLVSYRLQETSDAAVAWHSCMPWCRATVARNHTQILVAHPIVNRYIADLAVNEGHGEKRQNENWCPWIHGCEHGKRANRAVDIKAKADVRAVSGGYTAVDIQQAMLPWHVNPVILYLTIE